MSEIDLSAPEVQSAIEQAVAKATEALSNKNRELLAELKKAKQGRQVDPAEIEKMESQLEEARAKLAETERANKKLAAELETVSKRAGEIEGAFHNTLRDAALSEALVKAGVTDPVLQKAAKALLAGQAVIADVDGQKVVKAGDKALPDFITEWASSDEGKRFVSASPANGGGSQGNGYRGGSTKPVKEWSDGEKASFIREHGLDAWKEKLATG